LTNFSINKKNVNKFVKNADKKGAAEESDG